MAMDPMEIVSALRGIQPPTNQGSINPEALFGVPRKDLMHLAGDVLPIPIIPGPNAGPTAQAGAYGAGVATAPNVLPIGLPRMIDWAKRIESQ